MKDNPLISIYMPTWNRQQLAIRAIKSVLRQDYSNWEMIIVDDCSTSWEQLQQYVTALNDPRITYIHNDINSGACAVRNQAIMLAQGEYITGIDDDDEWTQRMGSDAGGIYRRYAGRSCNRLFPYLYGNSGNSGRNPYAAGIIFHKLEDYDKGKPVD